MTRDGMTRIITFITCGKSSHLVWHTFTIVNGWTSETLPWVLHWKDKRAGEDIRSAKQLMSWLSFWLQQVTHQLGIFWCHLWRSVLWQKTCDCFSWGWGEEDLAIVSHISHRCNDNLWQKEQTMETHTQRVLLFYYMKICCLCSLFCCGCCFCCTFWVTSKHMYIICYRKSHAWI